MKILIVGAGRIGSAFALQLGRAGHEVTMLARGTRLAELRRDPAIVPVRGERAPVGVVEALDQTTPWDLVLVTVLAHQVDALLPELVACAGKTVMFMFNTFEPTARLRDTVGAQRFAFAFPTVIASFVDGKLKSSVNGPGQITTVSDAAWVKVFTDAEIRSEHQPDMDSFLRSHVAFVIPLMAMGAVVYARGGGLTWAEARRHVRATGEAFAVVRALGHKIIPGMVAVLYRMPAWLLTALFWAMSRAAILRELGAMGSGEVKQLIDAVVAASPVPTPTLAEMRGPLSR